MNVLSDVSVVIVNWNGMRYLHDCLSSPFDGAEVILVDNASSDGSVAYVRQHFPRIRVVENETNVGFSVANNIGAGLANGDYLLFLNMDTIVYESTIERMRSAFERDDTIGIVGARLERPDGRVQSASSRPLMSFERELRRMLSVRKRDAVYGAGIDYDRSHYTSSVCGAALMIRRDLLGELGGWPEEYFAYAEDTDLCRRILERGYRIWYESEARIMHYHGGSAKEVGIGRHLRSHLISHRSANLYIRRYEGRGKALIHASLYPLDMLLVGFAYLYRSLRRRRRVRV